MKNKSRKQNPLEDMSGWDFWVLMLARKQATQMFYRILKRAFDRGVIDGAQGKEIAGIWNRMVNGYGPLD